MAMSVTLVVIVRPWQPEVGPRWSLLSHSGHEYDLGGHC